MIPQEELNRLLSQATTEIENFSFGKLNNDNNTEIAELYFTRADIYLAMKKYRTLYKTGIMKTILKSLYIFTICNMQYYIN